MNYCNHKSVLKQFSFSVIQYYGFESVTFHPADPDPLDHLNSPKNAIKSKMSKQKIIKIPSQNISPKLEEHIMSKVCNKKGFFSQFDGFETLQNTTKIKTLNLYLSIPIQFTF